MPPPANICNYRVRLLFAVSRHIQCAGGSRPPSRACRQKFDRPVGDQSPLAIARGKSVQSQRLVALLCREAVPYPLMKAADARLAKRYSKKPIKQDKPCTTAFGGRSHEASKLDDEILPPFNVRVKKTDYMALSTGLCWLNFSFCPHQPASKTAKNAHHNFIKPITVFVGHALFPYTFAP